MKRATDEQIEEIAEEMIMGQKCYWNKKSSEPLFLLSDDEDIDFDRTVWDENLAEFNKNFSDYVEIEMLSDAEFQAIMSDFAESLTDSNELKSKLLADRNSDKPFKTFEEILEDYEDEVELWFEFQYKKVQEIVIRRMEQLLVEDHRI